MIEANDVTTCRDHTSVYPTHIKLTWTLVVSVNILKMIQLTEE